MLFLKQGSESALRISNGTLQFHSFAADTEKVRPSSVWGHAQINFTE